MAHERWAAGRSIPAQAWCLVSKFMNDAIFEDICTLFVSQNSNDNIAAALVCRETNFLAAKEELKKHQELQSKTFSWSMLEV